MDSTFEIDKYSEAVRKIEIIEENSLKKYYLRNNGIEINIGGTPVCFIEDLNISVKLEWFNYFHVETKNIVHGSIKMRPALNMIMDALIKRNLNDTLIEPTSGNTGIAIGAIAKALDLNFQPVISYKVTDEVKTLFKAMGIEPIEVDDDLCPRVSNTDTDQAIAVAKSMAYSPRSKDLYTWLNQYENSNNPSAHKETAAEILALDDRPEYVVVGVGTGGTYVGLKNSLEDKGIKVIGVQPEDKHHLQGLRNLAESPLMPKILENAKVSKTEFPIVSDKEAFSIIKEIYDKKNVLVGASSGATIHYANKLAEKHKKVLAIVADTGYNYQTLYRDLGILKEKVDFSRYYSYDILKRLKCN
ncbi:MAG: pyridoxal-phosphate dependent enzyme [Thermoplasmata archaeon]